MKKIIFSIVGSMLISLCALQAQQQDTTGMASKSRDKQQGKQRYDQSRQQRDQDKQQRDQAWQQQDDKSQNTYANEGMVIIDKDELPASLKKKLQGEKYAGWENATIYHNTNTGEYVIAPRAYRFDEQGKEIEVGTAYGSRDGQRRHAQDQTRGQNQQDAPERTYQSQQGQDARDETSTYSSGKQSDQNDEYKSQSAETKRNQTRKTQPQTYDQAAGNQQPSDDQSTRDQQNRNDPSSTNDQETADQSTQSQEQSSAYRRDQSQQSKREGQQPSTGYRSGQRDDQPQNQSEQSPRNEYVTEDMVEVQDEQIPATLRRTLRQTQYSGWEESGTLYRDPATNEYVLVMEKSNDTSEPRAYRFDKNGQLKDDQNGSGGQSGASQRNNGQ